MVLAAIAAGGLVALAAFGLASRSKLLAGPPPDTMVDASAAAPAINTVATAPASASPPAVVEAPPPVGLVEARPVAVASGAAVPTAKPLATPLRVVVKRPAEPDCSPPFFFDAAGNKKVKPGC